MTWTVETHGGNKQVKKIHIGLSQHEQPHKNKEKPPLYGKQSFSIIMMISTSFSFLFAYSTTENVQGNVYRDIETLFGKASALNNQWIS